MARLEYYEKLHFFRTKNAAENFCSKNPGAYVSETPEYMSEASVLPWVVTTREKVSRET